MSGCRTRTEASWQAGRERACPEMGTFGVQTPRRVKGVVALGLAAILAAVAQAKEPDQAAGGAKGKALAPGQPIVIGVSCVQSGPSQELGLRLMQGSRAYFDGVNRAGGIHGHAVQLIVKDDGYEPDPAIQNTYDLITRDGAFFLFNYVGTPTLTRVLPLLKYFESERVVMVAPFTGAEPQRRPPFDGFVFNIRASYRDEIRALVEHFLKQGHRRIGFFGQSDAYGKSGETAAQEVLQAHGLELTGAAVYRRNQGPDASMADAVGILRRSGCTAILSVGVYGPCAAFIRDARMSGWEAPIANVSFVSPSMLLERLRAHAASNGPAVLRHLVNSTVVPAFASPAPPLVEEFAEASRRSEGTMDPFIGLEGWLNAAVVTEALRRAPASPTRSDFIRAMESLQNWDPGIGIPLTFSPTNHQATHKVWLVALDGSARWRPLDPPETPP